MSTGSNYHRWAPLAVLSATLLMTSIITWQFQRMLEAGEWARFQSYITQVQDDIDSRLQNTIALLRGGAGLFAASESVTREQFRRYVERLSIEKGYPGIQGIGWSRRVLAADKDDFVKDLRNQGVEGFRIWPEYERAEYHAIVYLEPLERRNQAAIGYDMFTEPVRRAAMERARDAGATLSGKVTLVQEIDALKQAGFLIYAPVYQGGGMPDSVAERRNRLLGFVYSPLRAGDFLADIVKSERQPPVSFEVFDGSEAKPDALLYRSERGPLEAGYQPRFSVSTALMMAGRPWTLLFATLPAFNRPADFYLAPGVFLSGALISLLLTGVTWMQTKARQAADASAAQLRCSQQALQHSAKALQSSQERLHLALEAAHMAVWEWDLQTGSLQQSAEMGPLFGRCPGQPHPSYQAFLADIHPQDRERVDHTLQQAISGCVAFDAEFRLVWSDGGLHWLAARGKVICATAKQPLSIIGVALDISERKRAEEELKEADRRKNVFLATLAHELRNPLATISNSLYILKLADSGQSQQQAQAMAERQLGHLVRLVDDLLDISRIVQGKIKLQKERVELSVIVENAIDATRSLIASAGHELTVTLSPEPLLVEVDAARITQVLTNLLSNAAKYTKDKGRIWLATERQGDEAVVRVRDTGMGIAPALLPRVFDLFMQADSALDRAQGGMGIGLTLVKSLIQLHQGSVEAHSEGLGKGSEFVVRLPLAAGQRDSGEQPSRAKGAQSALQSCRILVVDDNEDSADSTALLLQTLGHEVQLAYDGRAALAKVETFKPDMVLLDIGLPGMDGYQVARHMRQRLPDAMLVAMTGWGSADTRRRSEEAGFDHHLLKPVDVETLNSLLAGLPSCGKAN